MKKIKKIRRILKAHISETACRIRLKFKEFAQKFCLGGVVLEIREGNIFLATAKHTLVRMSRALGFLGHATHYHVP